MLFLIFAYLSLQKMVGSKKKGKGKKRLDTFYDLAKRQGYRARSAFKLIQLNRKYEFLNNCSSVIDLCAAPGGWMQVAQQYMPVGSTVIGVDLAPIKAIPGCKAILGDIYSEKTKKAIEKALDNEKAHVVLHDGAPNVGGVWLHEVFAQQQLVLQALKISTEHLAPNGWFVTKVFRDDNFNSLLWVLKQFFAKVEATKPLASRAESAEIYVICSGYKNPSKIDPKFFKISEVFRENQSGPEEVVPFAGAIGTKSVQDVTRNIHCKCTASAFLRANDVQQFLKQTSEIVFDKQDELEASCFTSTYTTKEILSICSDIKQASDADIKRLLRWRERLKEQFMRSNEIEPEVSKETRKASHGAESIQEELEQLKKRRAREEKKKMKRVVDRRLKHMGKILHHDPDIVDDGSLSARKADHDSNLSAEMPVVDTSDGNLSQSEASSDGEDTNEAYSTNALNFFSKVRSVLQLETNSAKQKKRTRIEISDSVAANPVMPESKSNTSFKKSKDLQSIIQEKVTQEEVDSALNRRHKHSDVELSLLDPEKRAETLALATRMLNPKHRESIIEDSINRYTRGEEDLPDWFVEDERKHYFRTMPITKEELEVQKRRFMEINVRPSKKVMEAISRKRRRASRILKKVQQKGKTDPRMKEKGENLSIRTLMRSKTLNKTHRSPMDNKMKGEMYRTRQKKKRR